MDVAQYEIPGAGPASDGARKAQDAAPHTLASVRGRILEALQREDVDTIQKELPRYQDMLQQAIEQPSIGPERMMRLEAEHQRFHEQLRASLLTMRIALRLDLERVRVAKQYQSDGKAPTAIDMEG